MYRIEFGKKEKVFKTLSYKSFCWCPFEVALSVIKLEVLEPFPEKGNVETTQKEKENQKCQSYSDLTHKEHLSVNVTPVTTLAFFQAAFT